MIVNDLTYKTMRSFTLILLICIANIGLSQVSSFPYSESFETAFTTGTDVAFISNWTGNTVATSDRIFQGTDPRTGSNSLNVIPLSTFDGEILISLNLTGISNPNISFYAFSKQNGVGTRPALLSFETSINGGSNYLDNVSIGDNSTFPNDNTTSYSEYSYDPPAAAAGESNVVVRITVTRGTGTGTTAELVMDDFTIENQPIALAISSSSAASSTSVVVTFNQEVTQVTAETTGNYALDNGISVTGASRTAVNEVTLTTATMPNNNYTLTVNNVEDAATNTPASNLQSNFSFIEPLAISSTNVVDENTIELNFNLDLDETSAESTGNYAVDNGISGPSLATLDPGDSKKVTLDFSTDLANNTYQVTVNNVQDVSTLATASNLTDAFSYLPLEISSTASVSSTSVLVTFNQDVNQASAEIAGNYTLNNGITVSGASRSASNQVTLTTSVMPNNNYQLTINSVVNTANNSTAANLQDNFSFVEPLAITSTNVTDKNTVVINFNLNLDETSAESVGNYSVDNSIGVPATAVLNPGDNTQVTLTFASDLADDSYQVTVNGVQDVSTLATATNLTDNFTYLPLSISSLTALSTTQIQVTFNQDVETSSANTSGNYSLNFGFGNPTTAVQDGGNAAIVVLTFSNAMVNNTYALTVDNVTNTSGNTIAATLQSNLTHDIATNTRRIVISEIFADPTGSSPPSPQVLPNATSDEYIELFNTTSEAIDIGDFDITGGTIGTFVLQANSYVILTATSNVTDFQPFGDVIGVTSWNTLSNGGEQLILRDNLGNIVDSLTYDQSWYNDAAKSDGGWSLEQINPELICSDANNWSASTDIRGGSPGSQNSVHNTTPDTTGPSIVGVSENSSLEIVVTFDEIMDQASLAGGTYLLDNGLTVASVAPNTPSLRSATLTLNSAMTSGTLYELTVTGVTDCAGNAIDVNAGTYVYDVIAPIFQRFVLRDTLSMEVIFDEEVEQTSAETEANFSLDQGIGNPTSATLSPTDNTRITLDFTTAMQLGSAYNLTHQNLEDTLGNASSSVITGFSFQNFVDTVIVISSQLLDVYFDEDLDETTSEIITNYTVDRGIGNPNSAALDNGNARLVHLIFDNSFAENTAQVITFDDIRSSGNSLLQLLNTSFVYDTDDPDIDSVVVIDDQHLRVYFDERLDQTSAESVNNYTANNGIGSPSLVTLQSDNSSVILEFSAVFEQEVQNILTITGVEDPSGNAISNNRNFNFTHDTLAARLVGIVVLSPTTVSVEFSEEVEQTSAENTANYSVDNSIGNPTSAVKSIEHTNIVLLTFADLGNNSQNTLTISNIVDTFDNVLPVPLTASFSSNSAFFGALNVVSDTSLSIQFNKVLDQATAENRTNYGFDNGIGLKSLALDLNDASVINMTLNTTLIEGVNYRLVAQNILDEDGNTSGVISYDFQYDPQIVSIGILTQNSILITFDEAVDETTAENVANYAIDKSIGAPLTAVRNNLQPEEVTLFFNNALTEGTDYVLSVRNVLDSFSNMISASNNSINYDASAPFITAINSLFSNEIEVVFNETVDHITAQTLNHYSLDNGLGNPIAATRSVSNLNTVLLEFGNNLVDGLAYNLTVDRVEDLQGKAINNSAFGFTFQAPFDPAFRDIVVNEIYFDTDLGSTIPNIEFIELYNRSTSNIQVRGLSIADVRDTAALTDFTMAPSSYLIVTSLAGASNFTSHGDVLGVANFPSLSNSGETIALLDRSNVIVDSLSFDRTYYNDNTKEGGGYTVELINPDKACFDLANYGASTSVTGGTPGVQNSIFDNSADVIDPVVSSLTASNTTTLLLSFNEAMDVSTLVPANFDLEDGIVVSSVEISEAFGKNIILHLSADFQKGVNRTLTLNGVADCTGNALSNSQHVFLIGETPTLGDLLVTEIMATPNPGNGLPLHEYIEIYNTSTDILAIEGVQLLDDNGTITLGTFNLDPQGYLILASPQGAAELSVYGDVLAVNSFPTLTITDQITLYDPSSLEIFNVNYDRTFYHDDAKDDGGYSIEMINVQAACFDPSNWAASLNSNGGTPGTQNSVYDISPDATAPQVASVTVINDQQLQVTFSESMALSTLVNGNFQLSGLLTVASLGTQDEFGTSVLVNLTSAFSRGTQHTLTLTGLTDCAGNALPVTNQTFFLGDVPGFHELIITEIMADPSPVQGLPEVEYLEIYNNSNRILALGGISLADITGGTSLPEYNIDPGAYLILTPLTQASAFTSFGDVLGVPGWRNLNSEGDNVTLSLSGNLLFEVFYTDEWYRDSQKANGGFSLEMIDRNSPCSEELNWVASTNGSGGTPGTVNSVDGNNPDVVGPSLSSALAISTNEIELFFDEKLDVATLSSSNFSIVPALNISAITIGTTKRTVVLTTDGLVENTVYGITANSVADCSGNLIQTSGQSVSLIIPTAADSLDLVVNEVLFNPNAGGVRFIEIYNNSTKNINLKNWSLAGHNNQRLITSENLIIQPGTYKVMTTDGTVLKNEYPRAEESTFIVVDALPNLLNTAGSVELIDNFGQGIDFMNYDEAYHSTLIGDLEGVSLERIRPSSSSIEPSNWFSASSTENFATPGYLNSQFLAGQEAEGNIIVQPATFAPDDPGRANFATLNYNFEEPGNVINVTIYDSQGNAVKQVTKNSLVGTNGFFRWDGTNDQGGKARIGYYMILFEIISPEGRITMKKEPVAIGGRF